MAQLNPELLSSVARSVMEGRGWVAADQEPFHVTPIPGRYIAHPRRRVVRDVQFRWAPVKALRGLRGTHVVAHIGADVGATCPAAERLLAAIGATRTNIGVHDDVGRWLGGDEMEVPAMTRNAAENAVNILAAGIEAGHGPVARTTDQLVALVRRAPDVDRYRGEVIPALLQVAGRARDALAALDAYRATYGDPGYDDFCDRFRGFVATGAPIPDPGDVAFPAAEIRARQAAAWRERVPEPEVPTSPPRTSRGPVGDIIDTARWGRDMVRFVRQGALGGLPSTGDRWAVVDTRETAEEVLRRAHDTATRRVLDTVFLEATVRSQPTGDRPSTVVLIGDDLAGHLPSDQQIAEGPVLGRLTHDGKPPRYFLEVRLPKASAGA